MKIVDGKGRWLDGKEKMVGEVQNDGERVYRERCVD